MIKYIIIVICFVYFCGCSGYVNTSTQNSKKATQIEIINTEITHTKTTNTDTTNTETTKKSINATSFFHKKNNTKIQADIMFVLDTYSGMSKYLHNVNNTFKDFIKYLSPISWRIAFTNADYDPEPFSYYNRDLFNGKTMMLELAGKILPDTFLDSYSPNKEQIFLDTLKKYESRDMYFKKQYINPCNIPPYCQGSVRNPIHSLTQALNKNTDFIRPSADFIGIIFTNGDEMNNQKNIIDQYTNYFKQKDKNKKKITIYSISIIPGDTKCFNQVTNTLNKSSFSYSNTIHKIVEASGGKSISICALDYSYLATIITEHLTKQNMYFKVQAATDSIDHLTRGSI